MGQLIQANETTTPSTPPSGFGAIFPKSDGHLYFQNAAGTVTQLDATSSINAVNVYTKNQSVAAVTLTDAATISVDASTSNNFQVVLGGNRILANPTNLTSGMVLNFRIQQDGAGSRTLTYGGKYKFPGGAAPTLSTAANAKDFMSCYYDAANDILLCNTTLAYA